jgi:hypothetical protein
MEDEKKPRKEDASDDKPARPEMGPRDEAPPGTPGTGENIDPKTGETYTEGIGGG